IPTAMNGFAALDEAVASTKLDQLSVRRWGEPQDVANLCLFLASDLADYITGALLDVSGGKFATRAPAAPSAASCPAGGAGHRYSLGHDAFLIMSREGVTVGA